jgi:hypothetical protein
MVEEVRDGLGVEARILPVLLDHSFNKRTDIKLVIKIVLV